MNRIARYSLLSAILMAAALTYQPVKAATATGSMQVSATVIGVCSVAGGNLAFGTYSSSQLDQNTMLGVRCTNGTSFNVALDAGTGVGATTSARKMTSQEGGTLSYSVFRDVAKTSVWGSSPGTDTLTGTGTGLLQPIPVYASIPANQTPNPGQYADTLTITITY